MDVPIPAQGYRVAASRGDWVHSPAFDLAFFVLSPLVGLALLLAYPTSGSTVSIAAAAMIGGPHYLASFSFYFWDDSAPYYRRRWFAFFVMPLLLILFVLVVVMFQIPAVILVLIYFWNAYHVSRQSCGILSLYRHQARVSDPQQKTLANAAIIGTNLSMALAHTDWYPGLHAFLARPSPLLPSALWLAISAFAAISLLRLAASLVVRARSGSGPRAAELAFLFSSLVLFHPYLWIKDADQATLGMLMGHFIQYLGIVWLVNYRKLADGSGSLGQRCVGRVWRDPKVLLVVFLACGALFAVLQTTIMAVSIVLVLLHFYLDGVFWAFKRPEIRKAMTPFLTRRVAGQAV